MACQIVAKEGLPLELANNDDSFRSTLFGKFRDVIAGALGEKTDAESIRKVLRILALLQPFHPDDPVIANMLDAVEGLAAPTAKRLIRLLSESGVLFRRGGQYRLSPDLLADFIIEDACVGERGKPTGYAEDVFDRLDGPHMERVLLNLGRLDWRLHHGDPSTSRLMDGIWSRVRTRQESCTKAVAEVAYYQPGPALDYAATVIEKGFRAEELLNLLKYASYTMEHAPRALDLLWRLASASGQNAYAERAVKVLADLCAVEPNKPFDYNHLVVDFGLALLDKNESWTGAYSPFDLLEGVLRTCGDICESDGRQLRIMKYSVSPAFVSPLRKQVVSVALKLLTHAQTKVALAAARFLQNALRYPMDGGVRQDWTREFVDTLEQIDKTMATTVLDPLVSIELARNVSWLAHYANDDASPVAKRILNRLPDSLEFRTTLALVDEHGEILERRFDVHKIESETLVRMQKLAADLTQAFPSAHELYAFIQRRVEHIRNYVGGKAPGGRLYWELLDAVPALADVTLEESTSNSALGDESHAAAALAKKLMNDHQRAIEIADRLLQSDCKKMHVIVGHAYGMSGLVPQHEGDLSILRRLLSLPDVAVFQNALWVLRRLAAANQLLALELLLDVDFGDSNRRADDVLALLGQPIPFEMLSDQMVQEYLNKLAPLQTLDGYWVETFLAYASQHHAGISADFLMKRVEHAVEQKDGFRPCNYGPFRHVALRFSEAKECNDILRRMANWMRSTEVDDYRFHAEASRLFEAMFGLADERILCFLGDWVDIATPAELESISAIVRQAEPEFLFEHRELVVRLLERADGFGPDVHRSISNKLLALSTSGVRSGVRGEPFPRDVKMKEEAEKALEELPRFSPAYDLFEAIRKRAEREIARCRQEAELFEE